MAVNKGIVLVIYSHAKGNFSTIRKITKFLDRYRLYAAVESEVDETKPPIVIEINLIQQNQRWIVPQMKRFVEEAGLQDIVKFTINDENVPSFGQMAKNLGSSLFKTGVDALKSGFKANAIFATAEEKERRLEICKGCDYFNHRTERCNRCGCKMRYKSGLTTAKCPLNKW
jgi:hypothetical protein